MPVLSNCNVHTSVKIADYVGLGWNKRAFISNKHLDDVKIATQDRPHFE